MTYKQVIVCDWDDCKEETAISVEGWVYLEYMSDEKLDYPEDFHFCGLECLSKYLDSHKKSSYESPSPMKGGNSNE